MILLWVLCSVGVSVLARAPKPASSYFEICHLSDPNINDCIKKTIMKVKPHLIKGIPSLNIVPIEPLFIPRMEMGEGSGNFELRQVLENLKIHGMSNFTIKNISINLAKKEFNATVWCPKLSFEGDYTFSGQIMVLPMHGKGKAYYNFTDITIYNYVKLETIKKDNQDYLRIKEYRLKIDPRSGKTNMTNLFNGNKNLGDSANKFLNENWKEAFETYRYLPETAFAEFLKSISSQVYAAYPMNELFPQ